MIMQRINLKSRWIWMLFDLLLIYLASYLAWYIRYELRWFRNIEIGYYSDLQAYSLLFVGLSVVLLLAFNANQVYNIRRSTSWVDEVYRLTNGVFVGTIFIMAATFGLRPLAFSRLLFLYDAVLIIGLLGLARAARRFLESRLRAKGINVTNLLIVGAGDIGLAVMRAVFAQPHLGYRVVGFVDNDSELGVTDIGRFKALGSLVQLDSILETEDIHEVILTLPWSDQHEISQLVRDCERRGVRARVVPDMFQLNLSRVSVEELGGIPLIGLKVTRFTESGMLTKRTLDVVITLAVMPFVIPVFLLITLLVRLESAGPIFFTQMRVGRLGLPFKIYKFRSMSVGAENQQQELSELNQAAAPLFKIPEDPRLTWMGRWLRKSSLDELPQLINVLQGEMSIVGPRPGLPKEVDQYKRWHRQRLDVLPGITGLWQVSGRSDIAFDEMCLLDIYYIENWSLPLDVILILRTIPKVFLGRGAY
jgi:exopolysaccharide biosynthesis polyprenyl glycosylphosphotransferase